MVILKRKKGLRDMRVLVAILGTLFIAGAAVLGQSVKPDSEVRITRYVSTTYALPESQFMVTLRLETKHDLAGVGVHEILPPGWRIHPLENAGAAFKRAKGQWVFDEMIHAGSTRQLVYEVSIPSADQLMAEPLPVCFSMTGTLQAKVPALEVLATGDSTLQVVSALPILSAIAHLLPQTSRAPDAIDLRLPQSVTRDQLTRALELWQWDIPVPRTNGERIDLATMNRLAAYYETCTPVDRPLPLGLDPELVAVRTVSTFLPYDSVLPPEGCFDPGLDARRFAVTVDITPGHDAYGVGLKEWVPAGWRVTPVKHEGFWYRSSQTEWVYPKKLPAGETVQIVYQVEILPSPADDLEAHSGCCGRDVTLVGTVSSGLDCSERDVTGETSMHVWDCLAVILAVSRWDAESDGLDVTLSDLISFPQVQRAVAIWLEGAPLPYTCGYTVGYETLKAIVAYWLTDTPVTEALPEAPVGLCEDLGPECYVPPGSYDWFCQMKEHQPATDRVGVPPSKPPIVDAGPDRKFTCSIQVVTLTATVMGGVPPYVYEWLSPSGKLIGSTPSIDVRDPGTYTLIVTGCGGCRGVDTVNVTEDIEPPSVAAEASQLMTCSDTRVTLTVAVNGGRPPYVYQWTGPTGEVCGAAPAIVANVPGRYMVVVTGANGCSANDSVSVTEDTKPPVVAATVDQPLTCVTTEVTLTANVSRGRPPYAIEWTKTGGGVIGSTACITVSEPGTYTVTATGANECSANDSVSVTEDTEPPVVAATVDQTLTCVTTEVTLTANVAGGRPPYAIEWTKTGGGVIGSTACITVGEPGTYTVTATGANGCSASDTVTVTEDVEPPVVQATVDRPLSCAVAEVTLSASVSGGRPPYTIVWTKLGRGVVGDGATITVSEPGTYSVTASGANGCSDNDSVIVTEDKEPPTVNAGPDQELSCEVSVVPLTVAVCGSRSPYTYKWQDSSGNVVGTTESVTVNAPDTYTVVVTGANGCSANDSVRVTENIEPPVVDAGGDQTLTCAITEVPLTANVTGGRPPYAIEWTKPGAGVIGSTACITVSEPGIYAVNATGANGCAAGDTVTVLEDVEPPTVDVGPDRHLDCRVRQVSLKAAVAGGRPPFTYEWTNSLDAVVGTADEFTVNAPDVYTLTVTGANGCSASDSVMVTQDIEPPVVDAGPDRRITCANPEATLNATVSGGREPYAFVWQDESGTSIACTESIVVSEPGTYMVTVVGANGCCASDEVAVSQDIAPPVFDAGPDRELTCAQAEVFIDVSVCGGTPPYTYLWTDECDKEIAVTEDITVTLPGLYIITVTGANGCSSSALVNVINKINPPKVDAGQDKALTCEIGEALLDATVSGGMVPYQYVWTNACGVVVGRTEDLMATLPSLYTLTVTTADGCIASDSVEVTQESESKPTSL